MASPGELVRCVAKVLGLPEATVIQHDRNLLVAGKRSKGGRGRSAAKVTVSDAVNLLIPVVADSLIKDTVNTWREYVSLPVDDLEKSQQWQFEIPPLKALPESHTLGDALAALIEAAKDGSLQEFRDDRRRKATPGGSGWVFWIRVTFMGRFPQARITIFSGRVREVKIYSHPLVTEEDGQIRPVEIPEKYRGGDLHWFREFSGATVFAIGSLLNT